MITNKKGGDCIKYHGLLPPNSLNFLLFNLFNANQDASEKNPLTQTMTTIHHIT